MSVSLCCRRFPIAMKTKFKFYLPKRNNGYVVLLPEINLDIPESAALMKDNMPDFSSDETEKYVTIVGKSLLDVEHGIRMVEQNVETAGCTNLVKEVIEPIEKISASLDTSWGIIKTLYLAKTTVMPSSTYVPLHHRARRARSAKFYSKAIYEACKECDQSKLTEEEQRVVDKFLLEGRLAGLDLEENKREELANIYIKMAEARSMYTKRVEVSSNKFNTTIRDPSITREMPDHLLRLMAVNKEEVGQGPWKVTLEPQLVETFLAYCPVRELRWNVWQAQTRIASQSLEDNELHNSSTLEKIRSLRRDEARLLGYKTYAHISMETKMAGSLEKVQETLGNMLQVAKPAADREIADLQKFAWERGFEGSFQPWDISFWERKQKRTLYNFQEEQLTDYFPFDKVWEGLLSLCEKMFDVKFVENKTVNRWHPEVRFFYIYEETNKPAAGFYLDPYLREDKLNSRQRDAYIVNITPAARIHKTLPLSSLIMHLDPPIYGKPALLTWHDVQILFKQFGHVLQQLLTTVTYAEVAGQSNVEWDAVEVVGNVFVHWLKEPAVLDSISGHYASGEKLPALPLADIDRHFAGHRLCEELFKAHLDLEMFTTKDFWQDIMKKLWPAHFVLPHDRWNSLPCSFSEIVTEQWSAAYFSHVWARMVAADVYSAFTEPDVDKHNIGERFRDTYLAFGGSCPPGEVFRRFRGRDPSPEAFLKHLGLH
ncbi:oligopeptidase A [Macrosteles quadrilineatus]|uniref:oligopeptidase A n=1 Tax=Macrosteles quadrilineatus TaxID=74068 RepID=UPI0023E30370|nr:oligopeptidase A [Macrosteles quadrilineatus]